MTGIFGILESSANYWLSNDTKMWPELKSNFFIVASIVYAPDTMSSVQHTH